MKVTARHLIWLLVFFWGGRDYRKLSKLDRPSERSSVNSEAGLKGKCHSKAFLSNSGSSSLPRPGAAAVPAAPLPGWAEGVRRSQTSSSKACLRYLCACFKQAEEKERSVIICLHQFCFTSTLTGLQVFICRKKKERKIQCVSLTHQWNHCGKQGLCATLHFICRSACAFKKGYYPTRTAGKTVVKRCRDLARSHPAGQCQNIG